MHIVMQVTLYLFTFTRIRPILLIQNRIGIRLFMLLRIYRVGIVLTDIRLFDRFRLLALVLCGRCFDTALHTLSRANFLSE